jgi:hypothetical protein
MRPTARGVSAPWFAPPRARSRPAPRLEGGLTYRSGLDRAPAPERSAQRIYAVANKILAAGQAGEPEVAA